jgi:pimeloyl-ACP methyl ester carboxylesterase
MTLLKIFMRTVVLMFGLALATVAAAEATPLASDRDMVTGVSVTEADCRAQRGRLWVRVEDRGFCVRFWVSTAGGSKDEALVAFDGDIGGIIDGKPQLVEQARSTSDESQQKAADYGSRYYEGPYFLIARPGTFGSSGHHLKDRRTLLEIRVASATLDALKRQYGLKRFHLVGQSGGGHTVAGLVQLRSDIGCAAIASAPISLRSMQRDRGHPIVGKRPFYDPIDHVNAMKQRPDLRLFVVSDRKDKLVSYRSQLEFVERVKAHNLPITHVTATANDKNSHGLFNYGLRLVYDCTGDQEFANKASPLPGASPVSGIMPNSEPRGVKTLGVRGETDSTAPPAVAPPAPAKLVSPGAQKVVLYEDPSDRKGKQYVGTVVWRTEPIKASGNQKADMAVRADIDIPTASSR